MEPCVEFIGYEEINGITTARFKFFGGRKDDLLRTCEECKLRLKNLLRDDLPHEQTFKALINWPN